MASPADVWWEETLRELAEPLDSEASLLNLNVSNFIGQLKSSLVIFDEFNRKPVWNVEKQRKFIKELLRGNVTAVFYLNKIGKIKYLHDGGNRAHALANFYNGVIDLGYVYNCQKTFRLSYANMPAAVKEKFDSLSLYMQVWDNLPVAEARRRAELLNMGTQMYPCSPLP